MHALVRWSLPLLLIVCLGASAEPLNDPQACTTITKGADRLACFDRAFAKPSLPVPASADLRALVTKERQCDLRAIHTALMKAVPPKSDYETKAAFADRGRKQIAAAGIPYSGIFCETDDHIRYDADKGGYKLDGGPPAIRTYIVEGNRSVFRVWSGDNQLAMKPIATVPAAVAQKMGNDIVEGAILDIVSPFYTRESSSEQAEREGVITITLHVEPRYIFVYNRSTYEILWSRPVLKCNGSGYISYMVDACSPGDKVVR